MGRLFLGWVVLLLAAQACRAEPVQIGVVEQPQCAEVPALRARIMFVAADGGWRAINTDVRQSLPKVEGFGWTIGHAGRNLGRITLKDPSPGVPRQTDDFFERDKLYRPFGRIPQIANPDGLFAGACAAPASRPMVIVSSAQVADPGEWKPVEVGPAMRKTLIQPLHLTLGRTRVMHCTDADGLRPVPFAYTDADIVLGRAYGSKNGDMLVSIGLDPAKYGCDGPADEQWSLHWFLIRQKEMDYLGRQMEFVDAGDYAGDGKTEFLFWRSAYNSDGYTLIFDDLRQEASYTWSYQ